MKVFVFGGTGNVGSRIVPALLVHGHTPILYVRSPEKLAPAIVSAIPSNNIVIGSAVDSDKMKHALLEHECDGVINAAGMPAVFSKTEAYPAIFKAVSGAATEAGRTRGRPLRVWHLAGFCAMDMPPNVVGGRTEMIMNYFPFYPDHRGNYEFLKSVPPTELNWSMLYASGMSPAKSSNPSAKASNDGLDLARKAQAQSDKVVGGANTPPNWNYTLAWVPLIGFYINSIFNIASYLTTLEQAAEFIVADLGKGLKSEYAAKRVVITVES